MGRRDDRLMKDIEKAVKRDIDKEPQIYEKDLVDRVKSESKPNDEDKKKFSIADIGYRLRFWWSNIHMNIKDGIYFLDSHGVFDRVGLAFRWLLNFMIAVLKWLAEKVVALGFKAYFNLILLSEINDQDPAAKERDSEGVSSEISLRIKGVVALIAVLAMFFSAAEIGWGLTFLIIIALFLVWNGVLYDLRGRNRYQYADAVKFCDRAGFRPGLLIKYVSMPAQLLDVDWAIEAWCNANIVSSKIYKDAHYGWVRKLRIKELDLNRRPFEAKELTDKLLIDFGLIPQSPSGDKANAYHAYYILQDYGLQSLEYLIGGDRGKLIDRIATDPAVAGCYAELADQIEARKKTEAEAEAKKKEEQEMTDLKAYCANNNLPDAAASILMKIKKNRDDWGFGFWRLSGDNIAGNNRYFSVRCRLLAGRSLKDVKKSQSRIASEFRHQILMQPLLDRGSFRLIVLLNSNLPKYSMKMADVKAFGSNNQLILGDTLTGFKTFDFNNQANHFGIFGKSGSGKSVEIQALIASFLCLKDYDYSNLLIVSSSKVGDFSEMKKAGAYVGAGLNECLKVAKAVLDECLRREKLFADADVANLWEYNRKVSTDKQLKRILFVFDELENALNSSDAKKSKEIEQVLTEGLNLYRAEGVNLIVGAQNALKSQIGTVMDKLTVRYVGNANKNVLDQFDSSLSDYFKTADSMQGRFFVEFDNLKTDDVINFGDTGLVLTQTPYISDLTASNLPRLIGQSFMDRSNDSGVNIDDVDDDGFVE